MSCLDGRPREDFKVLLRPKAKRFLRGHLAKGQKRSREAEKKKRREEKRSREEGTEALETERIEKSQFTEGESAAKTQNREYSLHTTSKTN